MFPVLQHCNTTPLIGGVLDGPRFDEGKEPKEHHIPAQVEVNIQGRDGGSFPDSFVVLVYVDPNNKIPGQVTSSALVGQALSSN